MMRFIASTIKSLYIRKTNHVNINLVKVPSIFPIKYQSETRNVPSKNRRLNAHERKCLELAFVIDKRCY